MTKKKELDKVYDYNDSDASRPPRTKTDNHKGEDMQESAVATPGIVIAETRKQRLARTRARQRSPGHFPPADLAATEWSLVANAPHATPSFLLCLQRLPHLRLICRLRKDARSATRLPLVAMRLPLRLLRLLQVLALLLLLHLLQVCPVTLRDLLLHRPLGHEAVHHHRPLLPLAPQAADRLQLERDSPLLGLRIEGMDQEEVAALDQVHPSGRALERQQQHAVGRV